MSQIDWKKVEAEVKQHLYTLPLYTLVVTHNLYSYQENVAMVITITVTTKMRHLADRLCFTLIDDLRVHIYIYK